MNTIHMTEEDWQQYFNQYPSPGLEFINNLSEALKKGWIDVTTAEARIKEIRAAISDIPLDKYIKEHQQKSKEYFNNGK